MGNNQVEPRAVGRFVFIPHEEKRTDGHNFPQQQEKDGVGSGEHKTQAGKEQAKEKGKFPEVILIKKASFSHEQETGDGADGADGGEKKSSEGVNFKLGHTQRQGEGEGHLAGRLGGDNT